MVETLEIIIDRSPKGRPLKWKAKPKKIGFILILIKNIEGKEERWYCKT